jgi:hypothetical protein
MGQSKIHLITIVMALGLSHAWAQAPARIGASPATHQSLGPEGILTPGREKILAAALTTHGHNFPMPHEVAAALGIPKSDAENIRQLTLKAVPFGHHVYAPLSNGGFLVALDDGTTIRSYRFDRNMRLVAAISEASKGLTKTPLSDAKRPAVVETKEWADLADDLRDGK